MKLDVLEVIRDGEQCKQCDNELIQFVEQFPNDYYVVHWGVNYAVLRKRNVKEKEHGSQA